MSYITDYELAEYVGTPDVQDTALLQDAVNVACKHIDSMCRRTFDVAPTATSSATARIYAVQDAYLVSVDDFWSTTELVIQTDDDDDGTFETTWTAADYELLPVGARMDDGSTGVYWHVNAVDSRTFPTGTRRRGVLKVTARWGWPDVPAAVRSAAMELGKDAYSARLNRGGVIVDGGTGAVFTARTNRLVSAWLAPYVRMDRPGMA